MAGVRGPLMSFDASGKLADSIVFSKWKGRNYVRQLVTPHNPRSASQTGMRAMFAFLANLWASIAAGDQSSWDELAEDGNFSPFNAYMKENQANWRDFGSPTEATPATGTGTAASLGTEAATVSGRNIILSGTNAAGTGNWGVAIFRELTTGFTLDWSNCIAVVALGDTGVLQYTDGPLVPDQYFYNFKNFTDDGVFGADETEVNATVT